MAHNMLLSVIFLFRENFLVCTKLVVVTLSEGTKGLSHPSKKKLRGQNNDIKVDNFI